MTPEHKTALSALEIAKAQRREAQKNLDAELSMLADAQKGAAKAHHTLDMARLSALTPASAHVRAARIRDAEIDAEAQDNEVNKAQRYVERATEELAKAQRVVNTGADYIIRLEGQAKLAEFRRLLPHWRRTCEELVQYLGDELNTPIHLLGTGLDFAGIAGRVLNAIRDQLNEPVNHAWAETTADFHARRRAELAREDAEQVAA